MPTRVAEPAPTLVNGHAPGGLVCSREDVEMSVVGFASEIVCSPAGVALLEGLEVAHRRDLSLFESPTNVDSEAVGAAVDSVETMSLGALLHRLVHSADRVAGPWVSGAPRRVAVAFELAPARVEIARAVATRFEEILHSPIQRTDQEWWLSNQGRETEPAFTGQRRIYCCGEFTWDAVWTVSSPPSHIHDDLINVWEMFPGPISRWRVPIGPSARVYEVHAPSDWARLVTRYPHLPDRAHSGWELPGPNQDRTATQEVEQKSSGAAARREVIVAMPDWQRIAEDYDGVHLSWAGMLTCEGHVIDTPELGAEVVSMVRYWSSERTLWLNDVLEMPEPLSAPLLSGRINGDTGINANDPARLPVDADFINARLGRQAVVI